MSLIDVDSILLLAYKKLLYAFATILNGIELSFRNQLTKLNIEDKKSSMEYEQILGVIK